MRWLRASHLIHVSASQAGVTRAEQPPQARMRSSIGGQHDVAGWGRFRRLPETGAWIWADHGRDPLPYAGSSLAAADLRLAELRSVSEISGAEGFPEVLGREAGRAAVQGDSGAFQADQAGGASRRRRRVPVALIRLHVS